MALWQDTCVYNSLIITLILFSFYLVTIIFYIIRKPFLFSLFFLSRFKLQNLITNKANLHIIMYWERPFIDTFIRPNYFLSRISLSDALFPTALLSTNSHILYIHTHKHTYIYTQWNFSYVLHAIKHGIYHYVLSIYPSKCASCWVEKWSESFMVWRLYIYIYIDI